MNSIKNLENLVTNWKERNVQFLPINIDNWEIKIIVEPQIAEPEILLEFGKYNAKHTHSTSFYKSYSRIIPFNGNE
jgi:hypothetical protein